MREAWACLEKKAIEREGLIGNREGRIDRKD